MERITIYYATEEEVETPERLVTINHSKFVTERWKETKDQVIALGRQATESSIFRLPSQPGVFERELILELPDHAPMIFEELSDVRAYECTSTRLFCRVSAMPMPSIYWYKDGKEIIPGGKYGTVFRQGVATLFIDDLDPEHAGKYSCTIINDLGEAKTSATLTVAELGEKRYLKKQRDPAFRDSNIPPSILLPLFDQSCLRGAELAMSVTIASRPEAEVTWYHGDLKLSTDDKHRLDQMQGVWRMTLLGVDESTAGEYRVEARNSHGTASSSATLTVKVPAPGGQEPPHFVDMLSPMNIVEGSTVKMECKVTGDPKAKVTWYRNRLPIFSSHRYEIVAESDGTYALIIKNATPEDQGYYMCYAGSDAGVDSTEARLNVQSFELDTEFDKAKQSTPVEELLSKRRHLYQTPPMFTAKLRSKRGIEGQDLKLTCCVTGIPVPSVKWYKDGKVLIDGSKFAIRNNAGLLSLEVSKCIPEDGGKYSCRARNDEGGDETSCDILVEEATIQESDYIRPKWVTKLPACLTIQTGTKLDLACQATGAPMPGFKWKKDTFAVEETGRTKLYNDTQGNARMVIDRVRANDAGLYMCTAQSKAGRAKCATTVRVIGMPTDEGVDRSRAWSRSISPTSEIQPFTSSLPYGTAPRIQKCMLDYVEVEAGEKLQLTCLVEGNPIPIVTWHKGDSYYRDFTYSRRHRITHIGDQHIFEIHSCMPSDSGPYTVTAKNIAGEISTVAIINVKGYGRAEGEEDDEFYRLQRMQRKRPAQADEGQWQGRPRPNQAPKFIQELPDLIEVLQGGTVRLDCRIYGKPEAPKFVQELPDLIEMIPGSTVRLDCRILGCPDPEIQWSKNGEILDESSRIRTEFTDKDKVSLVIDDARASDSGRYEMRARNEFGYNEMSSDVIIKEGAEIEGAPHFELKLRDHSVKSDAIAKLSVKVSSNEECTVSWYRDDKELSTGDHYEIFNEDTLHHLEIYDTETADSGVYTCVAKNKIGTVKSSCQLVVEDGEVTKFSISSEEEGMKQKNLAPTFTKELQDMTVLQGSDIILRCRLQGCPQPEVYWTKNGREITNSKDVVISSRVDGTHKLHVIKSSKKDSGVYACHATSGDKKTLVSANVRVLTPDEAEEEMAARRNKLLGKDETKKAPSFVATLRDATAQDADMVLFEVVVDGVPEPEVTWLKDGKPIRIGADFQINKFGTKHVLTVVECFPEDEGQYSCKAVNSLGETATCCNLKVAVPDDATEIFIRDKKIPADDSYTASRSYTPTRHKIREVPPSFIIRPRKAYCDEGQNATFKTSCDGEPKPEVRWEKNGKVLKDGRYKLSEKLEYHHLEISDVTMEDAGKYTCVICNNAGEETLATELIVYERPKPRGKEREAPNISKELQDETVTEGDRVQLQAKVKGAPEPEITWYKNGKRLGTSRHFDQSYDGKFAKLIINDIYADEGGSYECLAWNVLGEAKSKCELTVQELKKTSVPLFDKLLKSKTVRDGDKAILECYVTGSPEPTITWCKNGKALPKSPDFKMTYDGERAKLEIYEVYPEDEGHYECIATNECGEETSRAKLTVEGNRGRTRQTGPPQPPPVEMIVTAKDGDSPAEKVEKKLTQVVEKSLEKEESFAPEIIKKPKSVNTEEGNSAKFSLEIEGHPTPDIEWQKDGQPLNASERFKIASQGTTYTFEIPAVLATDSGKYTCVAKNSQGSEKISANLIVKEIENAEHTDFRHVKTKKRPSFGSQMMDQKAVEGQQVTFECIIEGVPKPEITWLVGKKEIKESKYFQMTFDDNVAKLVVAEAYPEDEGEYTIKAENEAGAIQQTADLFVKAGEVVEEVVEAAKVANEESVPEMQAIAPHVEDLTDNVCVLAGKTLKLKAKFVAEPAPKVTWTKEKTELKSDNRIKIDVVRDTTKLTIAKATPDDSGTYNITLENDAGSDTVTASVTVEDKPNPPAGSPCASKVKETSLTLSWYGPSYDGGSPVTHYKVELCEVGKDNWKTLTSKCKNTSYRVKDLTKNTNYLFRVSAENKHGFSAPGDLSEEILTFDASKPEEEADITPSHDAPQSSSPPPSDTGAVAKTMKKREVKLEEGRKFKDFYDAKEEIGKGRFGNVHRCTEKATALDWAAKFIKAIRAKDKISGRREVEVMNSLDHPKLLQLADAFEEKSQIILVMEQITGGELLERVIDDDYELTERECVHFMRQICQGVKYMHEQGVLHLDLKPENVMCLLPNSNEIKLIDFGLARPYDPKEESKVLFGTPEFVAPEVINYDRIIPQTDTWSVGVVCYVLLSGLSPFMGDTDQETLSNVTAAKWDFDDEVFDEISEDAKDFLQKLLVKNPKKRMTAAECLEHKWLAQDVDAMSAKRLSTDKHKRFLAKRKWQREQDREEYLKQEEPSFAGKVKDVKADEGQDAKFKAKYKGYPEPTVTWHRDGTQLESGDRYRVKTKQGLSTLTIEEVEEKDNGAYECRLHNVNGEASATGKLFVDTTGEDDSD